MTEDWTKDILGGHNDTRERHTENETDIYSEKESIGERAKKRKRAKEREQEGEGEGEREE